MSIENLLNHKCNIYHLVEYEDNVGYGLPGKKSTHYPKAPDISDIICHFKSEQALTIIDSSYKEFTHDAVVTLPIDTDIRFNDKIVDLETNLEYIALKPRNIRGNHVKVKLRLDKSVV